MIGGPRATRASGRATVGGQAAGAVAAAEARNEVVQCFPPPAICRPASNTYGAHTQGQGPTQGSGKQEDSARFPQQGTKMT